MIVYFIQSENGGPIKIGQTRTSIHKRMITLQSSRHDKLVCLGAIRKDNITDSQYHDMFKHLKINGEWFEPAPELLKFIDKNTDKNFNLKTTDRKTRHIYGPKKNKKLLHYISNEDLDDLVSIIRNIKIFRASRKRDSKPKINKYKITIKEIK